MKHILLLPIVLLSFIGFTQEKHGNTETTTYFFIRHAEKDLNDPEDRNPKLTTAGEKRAQEWAKILNNISIDFVFSTNYDRTQQTAKPIADNKGLPILPYDPRNLYNSDFQQKTKGKTSVIVGHSNSTPTFVNKVLGKEKYLKIDEKTYGKLFIVKITGKVITDTLLDIN